MPKKIYNNVEDHKLLDGKNVIEDVTQITLPTITHNTSTIKASGMVADVDMPNMCHVGAMEFSVTHNNGEGATSLSTPGKHSMEVRVARQRYDVAKGDMGHESVKFRIVGIHKETSKGNVENDNPYSSTDKFSVLRYEEEVNGKIVTIVDATSGILRYNGKDFADEVQNLLK